MKKLFIVLAALLLLTSPLYAASGDKLSFQASPGNTYGQTAGQDNYRIDEGGRLVEATDTTDIYRYFNLPISSFLYRKNSSKILAITDSTKPGYEYNTNLNLGGIVWSDGETSPAEVMFRIPEDYYSSLTFKVFASAAQPSTGWLTNPGGAGSTPTDGPALDYYFLPYTLNGSVSPSEMHYSPRELNYGPGGYASLQELALAVSGGESFTVGQQVKLVIWRSDYARSTSGGTTGYEDMTGSASVGDLRIHHIVGRYIPKY